MFKLIIGRSNFFFQYNSNSFNFLIKTFIFKNIKYRLKKNLKFFFNLYLNYYVLKSKIFFFDFIRFEFSDFLKLLFFYFSFRFLFINIYKAHGINMRIIYREKKTRSNLIFLRLGYSHGYLLKLPYSCLFRVFKRRYFLISSFDFNYLSTLTYHLRNFRIFFKYKLIGVKLLRDVMKLRIGKKKSF